MSRGCAFRRVLRPAKASTQLRLQRAIRMARVLFDFYDFCFAAARFDDVADGFTHERLRQR
jgi:hypothetical protein